MTIVSIPAAIVAQLLTETADIERVKSGISPTERITIEDDLRCSSPQERNDTDQQRGRGASIYSLLQVYTAVPASAIKEGDRFIHNGTDYRIRKANPWPRSNPAYYELVLEDENR